MIFRASQVNCDLPSFDHPDGIRHEEGENSSLRSCQHVSTWKTRLDQQLETQLVLGTVQCTFATTSIHHCLLKRSQQLTTKSSPSSSWQPSSAISYSISSEWIWPHRLTEANVLVAFLFTLTTAHLCQSICFSLSLEHLGKYEVVDIVYKLNASKLLFRWSC